MENSAYRSDVYLRGAHANKDRPSDDQMYQRPMSSYTHINRPPSLSDEALTALPPARFYNV